MRQRDTGQKEFSKPRDQGVERIQRVAAPQAAPGRERSARRVLLRQLGARRTLRQAILLSEILGPPMALYDEPKDLVN